MGRGSKFCPHQGLKTSKGLTLPCVKAASLMSGHGAWIQGCSPSQLPHCSMPKLWWYLWTLCGKEKSVLCVPEICNRFVITNTTLSGAGLVLQKSRWSLHRQCVKWASNHWEQRESISTALSNFPAGPTNYKVRTTIIILYSNYLHDKGHHISLNSHLASALQN